MTTTRDAARVFAKQQRNPRWKALTATMKWIAIPLALLVCAHEAFTAADPMQTLLAQTVALIDCDPASSQIPALDAETADIVATQEPNGQWPDVNYTDNAASAWATAIHLQRVLLLATVARCPASRFHGNTTVAAVAARAAQWWISADPSNPNWCVRAGTVPTSGVCAVHRHHSQFSCLIHLSQFSLLPAGGGTSSGR